MMSKEVQGVHLNTTLPLIKASGIGPKSRESLECLILSPTIQQWPCGTCVARLVRVLQTKDTHAKVRMYSCPGIIPESSFRWYLAYL